MVAASRFATNAACPEIEMLLLIGLLGFGKVSNAGLEE
jgi:hypothetical protein